MGRVGLSAKGRTRHDQKGFTLVELSVVLVIVAFIVAGGLAIAVASVEKYPYDETQKKIAAIEKMLMNYRKAYDRLPCPANITTPLNAATFGAEANEPGDCSSGVIKASFGPSASVVAGMVPIRTLGLTDEYAFDGWGRRFFYVVDRRVTWNDPITGKGAFKRFTIADDTVGSIIVKDLAGTSRTVRGLYVVLSHGKNGHGAFRRDGNLTRVQSEDATGIGVGTNELDNCDCGVDPNTPSYPAGPPYPAIERTFFQQPIAEESVTGSNDFDDIVVYKTRQTMRSGYE